MADQAPKTEGVINPPATTPPVADAAADAAKAAAAAAKPADAKPDADPSKAADAAKPGDKAPEAGAKPPENDPTKPPEKTPDKPAGTPESYDLKVPENSLLSGAHVDALKAYAKESGLSNDAAQALLQREHNAAQAGIEAIQQRSQQQSQVWLTEAQADKEIGGEKFAQNVELANHALNTMFPDIEIKKFMDATGFGNKASVIKGFAKIGRMLKPDAIVQPPGQPPPRKDPVKTMYDHPTSQQKL